MPIALLVIMYILFAAAAINMLLMASLLVNMVIEEFDLKTKFRRRRQR